MTTTAEPAALPDAGPCRWCTDPQWRHKRGKGGCQELDCPCDKYLPPKDRPAPAAEPEPVADIRAAADLVLQQPGDQPDPVECVDVVKRRRREPVGEPPAIDPAAQAESLRQVAEIDEQLAEPEPSDDEIADEIDRAEDAAEIERLTADRDRLAGQLDARLSELDAAQDRVAQLQRQVRSLTAERNEERTANAALQRELADAQAALRNTATAYLGTTAERAAAANFIGRYTAYACLACGARYGKPFTDHEHGPLTPVVVTIARADRRGPDISKESTTCQ